MRYLKRYRVLGVVVVLTSQAYNWYVEKSKRAHDDVERSFYDAIMVELI
jgi:Tfp pilus assembly protein PilE